ncbi:hypothetical protein DLAC_06265 [Tieghemostelium lacteum]|uniref:Major facilitator superfamily (MFS) profile domain-containing protein n=1 Tax=Tieghemostelium lacteum TaxID=361077 RepID=A0A151ZEB9_TIELA|nr:hypothetical protein DLAC_06265 [Tieghemostelium lacteum]|eukprot:KYQ92303.1 hypothetical protein DLAC_06265 [Tieghemostelium lacteum]
MVELYQKVERYFQKSNQKGIKFPSPLIPKIFYFLLFACFGSWRPFLPLWLDQVHISPSIIGLILFFPPLITFFSSTIIGVISDKYQCHKKTFLLCSFCSSAFILSLKFVQGPTSLISLIIFTNAIFWSPLIPLIDSSTYQILGKHRDMYGQQRLYGSLSFAASAFLVSQLIERFGMVNVAWVNYAIIMMILSILVNFFYNTEKIDPEERDQIIYTPDGGQELNVLDSKQEKDSEEQQLIKHQSLSSTTSLDIDTGVSENQEEYVEDIDNEIDNEALLFLSPVSQSSNPPSNTFISNNAILSDDIGVSSIVVDTQPLSSANENDNSVILQKQQQTDIIEDQLTETPGEKQDIISQDAFFKNQKPSFIESSKILLSNPKILLILFNSFVISTGMSVVNNFLGLTIENNLDGSTTLIGIAVIFNVTFEIIFFFFGKTLMIKVGVFKLIILSHVALILRTTSYCFILHLKLNAWSILPVELLHGIVFSTIWSSGSKVVNENSPKGLEASGQSLFFGVYLGLGSGLGALIGGALYHSFGPITMFAIVSIGVTVGLFIFLIFEFVFIDKENNAKIKNIINNKIINKL